MVSGSDRGALLLPQRSTGELFGRFSVTELALLSCTIAAAVACVGVMHGRRGQSSSEPVPGWHPLCDRRARGPYLLAISRISRWPQDRFAGRSGGADKIPQRFRQARKEPQRRPKKIVSWMEQR